MKLRPNSIVEELVDEFQKARPMVLQLGRDVQATRDVDACEGNRKRRKLDDTDIEEVADKGRKGTRRRITRSHNQRRSESQDVGAEHTIDDEQEGDFQRGKPA